MEVDVARRERRVERLAVHPGEHQHLAVRGVADDRRDEAVGAEADGVRVDHAATARTDSPAAAIAALTPAIECWRRWKIDAARTASAPPSTTAATKSSGPGRAARRDDRDRHRVVIARSSAVSKPDCVPSRSIEVTSSSPGAELHGPRGPSDRVEAGRFAAALHDDLPGRPAGVGRRRASIATTTAWLPKRRAHAPINSGSATAAVFSETLSAPARRTSRISSTLLTPPPTVSGMNARRAVRSTISSSVPRPSGAAEMSRKTSSSAPSRGVALGELGRIALVGEVDEARALHDAAVRDVKAGDDAASEHQAVTARSSRATLGADRATTFARSRSPSSPLRSGWNWTPSRRPRATAETNGRPWVVVARTTSSPAPVGHAGVRVDEVEVGPVGDPGERRVVARAARPGSSRCGGASARPRGGRVRPGRTPSVVAPSSSLPSKSSWRPRQIPRNGRSSAIQRRIGSTSPAAPAAPWRAPPLRRRARRARRRRGGRRGPSPGRRRTDGHQRLIDADEVARAVVDDREPRPRRAGRDAPLTRASPSSRPLPGDADPARRRRGAPGRAP